MFVVVVGVGLGKYIALVQFFHLQDYASDHFPLFTYLVVVLIDMLGELCLQMCFGKPCSQMGLVNYVCKCVCQA